MGFFTLNFYRYICSIFVGIASMNNNLLIIGAGCFGLAAKETAEAMGCFEKISFLDDNIKETPDEM